MDISSSIGYPMLDERRTPAFIINYNRLTLMSDLALRLCGLGLEPIIVDNDSDYQPLLDYYENNCPWVVFRMKENYGYKVVWEHLFPMIGYPNQRYVVTDSDLCLDMIPNNMMEVLNEGLDRYWMVDKCGLSLEINDLPDTPMAKAVIEWESQFWTNPLDEMYYHAITDTTLALYRETVKKHSLNAIRTNRPYTAKHLPWYYTDINELPEDEQNYIRTTKTSTHWTNILKGGI
jgi:hypothetical protein